MERGERERDENLVEVEEVSEHARVYRSSFLRDELAHEVALGLSQAPGVESVHTILNQPSLGFEVHVADPELWKKYTDAYCRETITMAIESQRMLD